MAGSHEHGTPKGRAWVKNVDTSKKDWSEDKDSGTEHGKIHSKLSNKDFYDAKSRHIMYSQAGKHARYKDREAGRKAGEYQSVPKHRSWITDKDKIAGTSKMNRGTNSTGYKKHAAIHRKEEEHTEKDYYAKRKKGHEHEAKKEAPKKEAPKKESTTSTKPKPATYAPEKKTTVSKPTTISSSTKTKERVTALSRSRSRRRDRRGLSMKQTVSGT